MKKTIPNDAILIPESASKVFVGDIFDVYQWPQKMFDGSTRTFEMLKRNDTVLIIAIKDDKIVLIEDEQPDRGLKIQLPGGRTDSTDLNWLETAKRELEEETGFKFKNWKLISVVQPVNKIEWFIPIFLACDLLSKDSQKLDIGGEKITVIEKEYYEFRNTVLNGMDSSLSFLIEILTICPEIKDLNKLPEFIGTVVDR